MERAEIEATPVGRAVARWGPAATWLAGAAFLLAGLGSSGLWEPWEMDRADLARTLYAPPQAIAALAAARGDLRASLDAAAEAERVVLRHAEGPRAVREALDTVKREVMAAVVLDLTLLVPDPAQDKGWDDAGARVNEALRSLPNGRVLVVEGSGWPSQDTRKRLAVAQMLDAWETLRRDVFKGGALPTTPELRAAAEIEHARMLDGDRVLLVSGEDGAPLADALGEALAAGRWVVHFKEDGVTRTVAPLQAWAQALSYQILGPTELSTRLPGVLFALLALGVVLWVTRRLWGGLTATLSGLVLVTTPLFFAQARSVAGEPAAMAGLALVAAALLLEAREARWRTVAATLLAGLLIGLFSKGLFALATYAMLAVGIALVRGTREARFLRVAVVTAGVFGLCCAWVFSAPSDGFAGQFRFTDAMFAGGPKAYDRNFDLVVRQIGFGGFPWSPLYVIALGGLAWSAARGRDATKLAVALWFVVPAGMAMAMLTSQNQMLWPAAPAGAVAVGLLLRQMLDDRDRARSHLVALGVLLMAFILAKELAESPEPLAAFLTYDPPFEKQGATRFPEGLKLSGAVPAAAVLGVLLLWSYFSRLASFARTVAGVLRRPLGLWAALAGVSVFAAVVLAIRTLVPFIESRQLETASQLTPEQRGFLGDFLTSADPLVVVFELGGLVLGLVLLLRFILPTTREPLRRLGARLDARLAPGPARDRLAWAGAALWVASGIDMLVSVKTPAGYWGEVLWSPEPLLAVGLGALCAWGLTAWQVGRAAAGAAAFGVLGVYLTARLGRDASLFYPLDVAAFFLLGLASWGALALPRLCASGASFARLCVLVILVGALGVFVPLVERWDLMAPVLFPETRESLSRYMLVGSRGSWLCYFAVVCVLLNRWLPAAARELAGRVAGVFERGVVAVAAMLLVGVVVAASASARFYPELSYHVSQKHLVDTYRAAEQLGPEDLGDRIFKHGSFGRAGRKDSNFYTAGIPEIRDRQAALQVLLGKTDEVVRLETSAGTSTARLPGWDAANDRDGDGRRDWPALGGVATASAAGSMTDAAATWVTDAHAGKVLVDPRGGVHAILGNDATTLRLESGARPGFVMTDPTATHYLIDAPEAPVHTAGAPEDLRTYFLLPADSFSALNHAFRKISEGRHISVVDARSYRALLASSRLAPGEEQQNRYALHTLTRPEFDALDDPSLHRVWVNFEDKIQIVGYQTDRDVYGTGDKFAITVYYECLGAVTTSYRVFMHIDRTGTSNRIHADHWPLNLTPPTEEDKNCTGCYRTDHWLPGDIVKDVYSGEIAQGTPSGPQDVWTGLYQPTGDVRMKVKSWDKDHARHDGQNRVRIGAFKVR